MRSTLTLRPLYNSYIDIMKCFKDGIPLSCDQLHLLYTNYAKLSNERYDPIMRYYGILQQKHAKQKIYRNKPTFLLPSNIIDIPSVQLLRHRIELLVKDQPKGITIPLTYQQFKQLTAEPGINDLVFWHGNQTITGAPYYYGGIPHVDFFLWGNLFGVIKYEEIIGENEEESNILVYFEDKMDRQLAQCIEDYWRKFNLNFVAQYNAYYSNPLNPQLILPAPSIQSRPSPVFLHR